MARLSWSSSYLHSPCSHCCLALDLRMHPRCILQRQVGSLSWGIPQAVGMRLRPQQSFQHTLHLLPPASHDPST